MDPALAPIVLGLADRILAGDSSEPSESALQLLRGDAFSVLGHADEATRAYQQAMRAAPAHAGGEEST